MRKALPGLLTLTLSTFVGVTTEMLPVGLLPLIGDAFAISDSQAGLLVSLYALMVAVLAVPLTLATSRLPRKPLLVSTLGCYVLSNLLVSLAPTLAVMAAGRVLGGLTHALFFSVCIGYATRLVPNQLTGRALAIASAGVSAGFVLGVPLGVSLGTAVGWRGAFAALTVCALIALVLALVVLPAVPSTVSRTPARREQLWPMVTVISSNTLAYLGHYMLFTYVTVVLLGAGAVPQAVGPLLLLFGGLGLAALLIVSRYFDSHLRASGIGIVATIVIGIIGVASTYPMLAAVVVAALVWNTGFGPVSSLYQAAAVRTGATSPEIAGAWTNATCNAGIAIGAAIGGLVLDQIGISAVAWTSAVLVAAALTIMLIATRAFPRHQGTRR
nr:MFS transporter [Microbacterium ulmi]